MASFEQLKQTFFDECAEGMQLIEQGLSDMRKVRAPTTRSMPCSGPYIR